ncbi:aldehyde dehydrogenase [Klebsiella pneumoniae]|uniref:Aldehyde dehydrogenase n=1 Tax=Klebsiella pneumoniae TaxID=573 RepID=A0A377WMR0_KLEPN|nr:aldehyde dehydrogenase [Klebsiella pneumoniae]
MSTRRMRRSAAYKQSGVGRETHKMALDAYQQTKNLLVSYGTAPLGLFLKSISFLTDPQSAIHSGCGFFLTSK